MPESSFFNKIAGLRPATLFKKETQVHLLYRKPRDDCVQQVSMGTNTLEYNFFEYFLFTESAASL